MNKYNPYKHHRRSIRLQGYDYSQEGLYFVTLVCQDSAHLFGKVENGEMILNDFGLEAKKCWNEIPNHFPNVVLHEFVIMPNHIHGIIEIVGANQYSPENTEKDNSPDNREKDNSHLGFRSPSKTIGSIIRGFKIGVTKWMHKNTEIKNIWQRNYYEHIIRNEQAYHRISNYIINNPKNWCEDEYYKDL